jgi:N-acetylglutamate synthase-like GNAT family acetyltransferase
MIIKCRKSNKKELQEILNILKSEYGNTSNLDIDFLIATSNDKIIGCARLLPFDDYYELASVAVIPEYRKRGIGATLVKKVIKNNTYLICRKDLFNFYSNLGFVEVYDLPAELKEELLKIKKETNKLGIKLILMKFALKNNI